MKSVALILLCCLAGVRQAAATGVEEASPLSPVVDKKVNSPKEELRLSLFKDPTIAACLSQNFVQKKSDTEFDKELRPFIEQVIKAIKSKQDKELQPLFHKRLNTSLAALTETFAKLDQVYGPPFDVSVYKAWALNTVDGTPKGLKCDDAGVTVYPLYGYPLEVAVWLQVMGQNELGRILLLLVPADGKWNIGAFHMQQWTHAMKDATTWAQSALEASKKGWKEAAYVQFDLAAKLLDAGRFMDIDDREHISKARDAIMPRSQWEASIKSALPGRELVYATTLLVIDGAGILVRERVAGEISVEEIKKRCGSMALALAQKPWSEPLAGMRCSFLMPKEAAEREGALGGIYISFADAKKMAKTAKSKH